MLEIYCSGTPFEIGVKHGQEARHHIARCIRFYAGLFEETAKLEWGQVQRTAMDFEPVIRRKWPAYLQEMSGIASGAGVDLADILAINVRTEITFGLFSDGCTALSWLTDDASFLAQNWDWMEAQKENLVMLAIHQHDKPDIRMITEAGLIGKIGLNSAGVGVCLNAIRAKGMDLTRLPCHLGLRMVLESTSREDAVRKLERYGIASSCHMLVADPSGATGLEWSSIDLQKLPMNADRRVCHTNHYLLEHPGVFDTLWLPDSIDREKRIKQLCTALANGPLTVESIQRLFTDENNYPAAICRAQEGSSTAASLFNITMELKGKTAHVTLGRPTEPEESLLLAF